MKPKTIYLDYAAATPTSAAVLKAMQPYWSTDFANPSALYQSARTTRSAVEAARRQVAQVLEAKPAEIVFTAGATESINLALQGVAKAFPRGKILVGAIEHQAIQACADLLQLAGHPVERIPVDQRGVIKLSELDKLLDNRTVLVSIGLANGEVGTIQPWRQIKQLLRAKRTQQGDLPLYLHTDATAAAAGFMDLKVEQLQADLLTLNAAKIYGPKQVGALYVRRGTRMQPLLAGGGQESGLRPGSENVPGIVGLAAALAELHQQRQTESNRLAKLQAKLLQGLENLPPWQLNGHPTQRLPNNINLSIQDVDGEELVLYLDREGIQAATGAACSANSQRASHVLLALGVKPSVANSSLRLTMGRGTTAADVKQVIAVLPKLVDQLRGQVK